MANKKVLVHLGLNEADTLKSSTILIYYWPEQSLYTQSVYDESVRRTTQLGGALTFKI